MTKLDWLPYINGEGDVVVPYGYNDDMWVRTVAAEEAADMAVKLQKVVDRLQKTAKYYLA